MKIDSLEKLYHDQMAAALRGEEELVEFIPKLVGVATHYDLRNWIRDLLPHTRERIGRLEHIMPLTPITQQGKDAPGMKGLIAEGHLFLERSSDADIIDAGLVVIFQRILHDLMARYAALRTFAALLGKEEDAASAQRSLDELAEGEENVIQIAMDAVNIDALSAGAR